MIQEINLYLNKAQQLGIIPNFFMSVPYFKLSGGKVRIKDGWIWVEDGGQCICPPLPFRISDLSQPKLPIWASFPDNSPELIYLREYNKTILDEQYIFNPENFIEMAGGAWETFRKNCRKFPRQWPDQFYYTKMSPCAAEMMGAKDLIVEWMEDKMETLEDAEFLANFAHFEECHGIHRRYLLLNDTIVGINAWDENYLYLNYRICIVKKGIPFLSEFMRYLFYHYLIFHGIKKLVNDGGNLGNPDLAKFKMKMNPIQINKVYSLTTK